MVSLTAPRLPLDELKVTASPSSGPGGQHVNKTSTRVTVTFNVRESRSLSPEQREQIEKRLGPRISRDGNLRTVSQTHRSQLRNRTEALERMQALIDSAFVQRRKRRNTKPTRTSIEKRLEEKTRRSRVKQQRGRPDLPVDSN